MGQIIVRNLDDEIIDLLKSQAAASNRSLEQTVREILAAAAKPDRADLLKRMDALRAMSPPSTVNSTALIRADRDSHGPRR